MKTKVHFMFFPLASLLLCDSVVADDFSPNGTNGEVTWYTTYQPIPNENETTLQDSVVASGLPLNKPESALDSATSSPSQAQPTTIVFVEANRTATTATPTSKTPLNNQSEGTQENASSDLPIVPVGCYHDSFVTPRPLPELIGNFQDSFDRTNPNKTIMACARAAKARGYEFFGLQNVVECWSGENSEKTFGRDGPSLDCSRGVGESGANFVYRFPGKSAKKCKDCGGPRLFCFPGNALVETEDGKTKKMSQLQVGDQIKAYSEHGGIVYSQVIAFLHKNRQFQASFYKIDLQGTHTHTLTLSGEHILFKRESLTNSVIATFASTIRPGDILLTGNRYSSLHPTRVVNVAMVTDLGLYAPLTNEGTLFVNEALVSCYAHWPSHKMAHLAMAPLRLMNRATTFLGPLFDHFSPAAMTGVSQREPQDNGIHWYSSLLLELVQKIGLSNLLFR